MECRRAGENLTFLTRRVILDSDKALIVLGYQHCLMKLFDVSIRMEVCLVRLLVVLRLLRALSFTNLARFDRIRPVHTFLGGGILLNFR